MRIEGIRQRVPFLVLKEIHMVLFTSNRQLARAENIRSVFEEYDGDKQFMYVDPYRPNLAELSSGKYRLRVADEYVKASPGKCIFIGHGFPTGKKVGLEQPRPYHQARYSSLITYAIAPSENLIGLVARQCGIPEERVLPYGLPRTDAYYGKVKGDGHTLTADKRAYLYAPTFRNSWEGSLPVIDWDYIDGELTDDEIFIVKPHPNTPGILRKPYRHIIEVSSQVPSTAYLIDCDVLISDYSTIIFDAHVLRKPVILFEKDVTYRQRRGMVLKYPEQYASRYCNTEQELVRLCRSADGPGKEDTECREYTAGGCDGHSVEKICQLIRGEI